MAIEKTSSPSIDPTSFAHSPAAATAVRKPSVEDIYSAFRLASWVDSRFARARRESLELLGDVAQVPTLQALPQATLPVMASVSAAVWRLTAAAQLVVSTLSASSTDDSGAKAGVRTFLFQTSDFETLHLAMQSALRRSAAEAAEAGAVDRPELERGVVRAQIRSWLNAASAHDTGATRFRELEAALASESDQGAVCRIAAAATVANTLLGNAIARVTTVRDLATMRDMLEALTPRERQAILPVLRDRLSSIMTVEADDRERVVPRMTLGDFLAHRAEPVQQLKDCVHAACAAEGV